MLCPSLWLQSKKRLRELDEKLKEARLKKSRFSAELAQVQVGREETEERSTLLVALNKKQAQKVILGKELEKYKSCDPQRLQELRM